MKGKIMVIIIVIFTVTVPLMPLGWGKLEILELFLFISTLLTYIASFIIKLLTEIRAFRLL
jgi:hypothetical protein